MAKAPTQPDQLKQMRAARVAAGKIGRMPKSGIDVPVSRKRPMPNPIMDAPGPAIGSMTGTRPGGKGGPRPMGPGQVAQMAKLADMAGMRRMKGGGYLKKSMDGKASKGKTKGRNC